MEQDAASGLVTAHHGASVLLHGGRASESLWELCLPTLLWTEHRCSGHVPSPRLHHAGGVFMGRLVVCGGAPLDPMPHHAGTDSADPSPSSPAVPQGIGYWELDLDTLLWTEVACTGPAPLARSHHSATVVRGQLVVIGGRPTAGPATTRASAVTELMSAGYFDAHVLDIASRTWRNLSFQGSVAPALWGHSAVAFNDRYVLVFGGMDVSQQPQAVVIATGGGGGRVDDPPPSAALSDVVFTFDVESCAWSRCTPDPTNAHPPARAQHLAACFGLEMVVMCGFTAVAATGRVAPLADAWLWNVQSGRWRQLEPSAPLYPSVRPPAAMYYDQLVLLPSPQDVHFLSMRDFGPWQRVSASADLRRPVERNPFDADNATSGAARPLPTSAQRFMLEQEAAARRRAPDEAYPAADNDSRHHHSASPEALHQQARSAQSDVARGNSAAAWADQLRSRLPPREPVVADPWAAGAARGDHVTAPPPAREVSPELAKLQREVERLRQLAGPEETEARSARRDPSRPPVITYEPGRAAFAGETLRDAEHARGGDVTQSSPPPARAPRSFVDSYLRDADAREAQNASSSSSHPSLLLTASSIDDAALPGSLRDLRRYREQRQGGSRSPAATNRTARATTAAAPAADALPGRHDRNSYAESRHISPDAQQEHADAAISLLPSSRHHRTLQDEVTQPSYAPRR